MESILINKKRILERKNLYKTLSDLLGRKLALSRTAVWSVQTIALIVLSMVFIFPFFWMFTTAFKTLPETILFPPPLFPKQWMFENFVTAWKAGPFPTYLFNSIFIAVAVLIAQFIVIIPASYAFARKTFKGSQFIFGVILLGLMIPPQVTFLPIYLLFSKTGMINNYLTLILPFASSSFGIFLLTQNFKQIPIDIIEAAKLDKASELQIIVRVMLPMARPAIITFALFSFIAHWNDYFWVLSMTTSESIRTLSVGVAALKDNEGIKNWNTIMAGNIILVAPILAIYALASQQIKSAFTYSGIK